METRHAGPESSARATARGRFPGLERIDPGGIRIARGVHLILALLLGVAFGHAAAVPGADFLEARFGDWLSAKAPLLLEALSDPRRFLVSTMVAGVSAAHCILFVPAASRTLEWRRFRSLAPVVVGYFSLSVWPPPDPGERAKPPCTSSGCSSSAAAFISAVLARRPA